MKRGINSVCSLNMTAWALISASLALSACTASAGQMPMAQGTAPVAAGEVTVVRDRAAAERLLGATGVTLQWIDWNRRGSVHVRTEDGRMRLTGAQRAASGPGALYLDGWVREIGTDYFLFEGTIRITDTPDSARRCEESKTWRFAITQGRPYWRLREFEWCDGLTDYVDIYF